jgi:2-keto-4-pentenoate hydratase/2-oxohepta-3-ene-1,7-dioic acid hydratase in catechol pathway
VKLVRFHDPVAKAALWGVLDGDVIRALARAPYEDVRATQALYPVASTRLLPPADPSKIVCGGLNYYGHAKEVGLPVPKVSACFLKPPSSLVGDGDAIVYPPQTERLEYEAELAVVVARRMRNVAPEDVREHVLGYTCANDVTARDIQVEGGNFLNLSVSKAFDTFCPLGPWLETDIDPSDLALTLKVDGTLRQQTRTSDMIFPVEIMLSYFSHIMTLLPGDLVLTGTPAGIGRIEVGQTCEVTVEGIGTLSNPIVASPLRKTGTRKETLECP